MRKNIFSILILASCSGAALNDNKRDLTPSIPPLDKEFYYCEVDSEAHRKVAPAVRIKSSRMPDYIEFIVPTGGVMLGRCYMLALPDL